MFKILFAICVLSVAWQGAAYAACSADDAMNKSSEVSDVLSSKVQTKPDEASKMMSEMGDIVGSGTVTDQTCSKLDALMVRAKKL
jgi:hypothetical protein